MFVHDNPSVLEWTSLTVLALLVITLLIAILANLHGLKRYIHMKKM